MIPDKIIKFEIAIFGNVWGVTRDVFHRGAAPKFVTRYVLAKFRFIFQAIIPYSSWYIAFQQPVVSAFPEFTNFDVN